MDLDRVITRLIAAEGNVGHMYRCTGGKVTVGIGHAIETAEDAIALPFRMPAGVPADPQQIRNDYNKVAAAPKGMSASKYVYYTTLRMRPEDIRNLVRSDVQKFQAGLRERLPEFDTYPEPVQEALFDMAYNLGIAGLLKFQNLLAAIQAADWQSAARECRRQGIPERRNQETAALFLEAGALSAEAANV